MRELFSSSQLFSNSNFNIKCIPYNQWKIFKIHIINGITTVCTNISQKNIIDLVKVQLTTTLVCTPYFVSLHHCYFLNHFLQVKKVNLGFHLADLGTHAISQWVAVFGKIVPLPDRPILIDLSAQFPLLKKHFKLLVDCSTCSWIPLDLEFKERT